MANTLQKSLIFSRGAPLSADDIHQATGECPEAGAPGSEKKEALRHWVRGRLTRPCAEDLFESVMDEVAGMLIQEAVLMTDGNRSQAAKLLGLSRPTLHSKIEKFGLKFETHARREL